MEGDDGGAGRDRTVLRRSTTGARPKLRALLTDIWTLVPGEDFGLVGLDFGGNARVEPVLEDLVIREAREWERRITRKSGSDDMRTEEDGLVLQAPLLAASFAAKKKTVSKSKKKILNRNKEKSTIRSEHDETLLETHKKPPLPSRLTKTTPFWSFTAQSVELRGKTSSWSAFA